MNNETEIDTDRLFLDASNDDLDARDNLYNIALDSGDADFVVKVIDETKLSVDKLTPLINVLERLNDTRSSNYYHLIDNENAEKQLAEIA